MSKECQDAVGVVQTMPSQHFKEKFQKLPYASIKMAHFQSCFSSSYQPGAWLICSGNCEDNWWLGMQEKMRPPVDTESQTASCPSSYRGDPTQSVIADIFAILPGSQVITWRMWFLLVSPTFLFLHFSFQLDGNEDISIVNSQTMHRCDKKLPKITMCSH